MKNLISTLLVIFLLGAAQFSEAQYVCQSAFSYTVSGDTVRYNNTSAEAGGNSTTSYSFKWEFGDGSTSSDSCCPLHVYANSGTYTVCLVMYTLEQEAVVCADSACQQVTVTSPCNGLTAAWTDSIVSGNTVRFMAVDTHSLARHNWNYGDGTDGSGEDTTHTYAAPGTYHVCLYVYLPNQSCPQSDSSCNNITIPSTNNCGNINGTWTYRQAAPYDTVYFTSTVDSTNWSSVWTFGDGTSSTTYNPVHYYAQSGTYNVCRYIAYGNTCRDTVCQTITVTNYCSGIVATWTDVLYSGDSVRFSATDTVSVLHRDWNFGDGYYGSGINTYHNYATAGTYHVCLITYVPGECTDSSCENITVGSNTSPCTLTNDDAYYLYTSSEVASGDSFSFSSPVDSSYWGNYWTFGDGTSSDAINPSHVFAPGTYTVCRHITDTVNHIVCTDSFCRTLTITAPCAYNLTASWNDSVSGLILKVFAEDTNSTAHHIWSFGDGSADVNTPDTTHTYATAGRYRVCLYVYVPNSSCATDSLCDSITVGSNASACTLTSGDAYYYYTSTEVLSGDSFSFTASPDSTNWRNYWTFGDGTSSDETDPTHVFAPGTYSVCRHITDTVRGTVCIDSFCRTLTITAPCLYNLSASWTDSVSGLNLKVFATDTNSAAHHIWSFGDGSADVNVRDTTHTYAAAGKYRVCLYVYVPGSTCPTDSLCDSIQVVSTTGCGVAAFNAYIYGVNQIHAYSSSTGTTQATLYTWKLWNANGGLVEDTTTVANSLMSDPLPNGAYKLCLLLFNGNTFCDSICNSYTVNNQCLLLNANWTWNPQSATPDTIEFHSAVDSSEWSYEWIFGDGTTSSEPNLLHAYAEPGTYTVCHIVGVPNATCKDTICQSVTVSGSIHCGTASFTYSVYNHDLIRALSNSIGATSSTIYAWYLSSSNGTVLQSQSGTGDLFYSEDLNNGSYQLCLYIYSSANGVFCDSTCQTIVIDSSTVCSSLSAAFTETNLSGGAVHFSPGDSSSSVTYNWVFGDGSTSTSIAPTHTYAAGGLYRVCLYVSISGSNCTDTSCANVQTSGSGCQASFTFIQASNATNTIEFTNTTTTSDSVAYYRWSFGDDSISYDKNVTHTYSQSGTYYVCLTVGTYNGCGSTYCDSVKVIATPCRGLTSAFTYTTLQNGNIQFKSTDSSTAIQRSWTFGDGGASTNYDPVHSYATAGTYTVCLKVSISGTTCVDSTCTTITVGASGCAANFSYQSYYPPYNSVKFTNTSTSGDSIISYYWTFDDNTVSSDASPSHTYPHSGYWYTCLTITTLHGCSSTYCDSVYVQYDPCYGMSASFTYSYTNSDGVNFTPSVNTNANYNFWIFGDGTTSTETDPTHYYSQPGAYTVCHITGVRGSCADTTCETIQGTGTGTGCQADFTYATDTLNNHAYFTNTSTSTDSIISYYWTFGDDSTSDIKTPYHNYATPGTYYVCLTITSANGCSSTYCDSVKVRVNQTTNTCNASFTSVLDSCQELSFTNTSTGGFTRIYWNFGDGSAYDTVFNPTHVFPVGTWTVTLAVYGSGDCQASATESITVVACSATENDTVCGTVFDDLNGNGVQNTGEPGVYNAEVHIGSFVTHTDSSGHYQVIVPAGTYTIYYCAPSGYTFSIPVNSISPNSNTTCAGYTNVQVSTGSNCGYNFGILVNSVTICGTVYFDANNNHVQDPGESGIPDVMVILSDSAIGTVIVYTDQYGNYCAVVPAGTYVIAVSPDAYSSGSVYPTSITVNATTNGGSYGANNFGIYIAPGSCDLSITVAPNTNVTPGYPAWYHIEVCNLGTNVTSAQVNMFYDPKLTFNYASPVQTSQNPSTFTITWDLNNILPGSCQYYWVSLTADSNLTIGEPIFTLVNVITTTCNDTNFSNSIDTLHQTVNASWDPNNKTVSPIGVGPEGLIMDNTLLTYTVNFENDGNATAVNVVVHDTISPNMDISTFKMLGASSPFTMQLNGNVAIWKFNGIMLPDSATNAQASRGFVSYLVRPLQSLPQGTQITNTADVYFDYNAGVTTNTTLNTIDYALSVKDISMKNVTITLQPNPFNDYTVIQIQGADGPYQMMIYDMMGQMVRAENPGNNTIIIDRSNLASGVYMYQIMKDGKLLGTGKMVAQ